MSQKGGKTETGHELIRINELRSSRCTPEADSIISESLKKINFSVPEGVQITNWEPIDRFQKLVNSARVQGNIPFLCQSLGDLARVVNQQVRELESSPLVVLEWDDGQLGIGASIPRIVPSACLPAVHRAGSRFAVIERCCQIVCRVGSPNTSVQPAGLPRAARA